MKKVLIAYYSRTGNTKQMAEYIEAPKLIFDTMEYVFKMDMTDLGPFALKEDIVQDSEGLRACQDYGKAIGEKLSK